MLNRIRSSCDRRARGAAAEQREPFAPEQRQHRSDVDAGAEHAQRGKHRLVAQPRPLREQRRDRRLRKPERQRQARSPRSQAARARARAGHRARSGAAAPQTRRAGSRLTQAPTEVASARPTCASGPISAILSATLTATDTASAFTGVTVSPRARKVMDTLRMSTNGRQPDRIGRERRRRRLRVRRR